MFKKLLNNFNSVNVKRGIKLSAIAIAISSFQVNDVFAQDLTYIGVQSTGTTNSNSPSINTVPANQNSVTIQLWGAGGNGAGIGSTLSAKLAGGGGGSGGYSTITIAVVPGDTYTVNVGCNVATGTGNTNGRNGFDSFITGPNALVTEIARAQAGRGGVTGATGAGGTFGTGNTTNGNAGDAGTQLAGASNTTPISGKGANGIFPISGDVLANGGAAVINDGANAQIGVNGVGIGSGGSGAVGSNDNTGNKTGKSGGVGGQGRVIFTYSTATLPVSLISFNASASNNQANLSWETASESNNNRFEVSRSTDNITYVTVATIKGKGTTNQKSTYTALDVNPSNGVNYYKLIQIDNDGTTKELAIKSLNFSLSNVQELSVYPNPASGSLNVQIANNKSASSAVLTLISLNGQVALTKTVQLNEGINTLTLDISNNIVPGQYVLNAKGASINKSFKVNIK